MPIAGNSIGLGAIKGNLSQRNICKKQEKECVTTLYLPTSRTILRSCAYSEPRYNRASANYTPLAIKMDNKKMYGFNPSSRPFSNTYHKSHYDRKASNRYSNMLPSH